MAGFYFVSDIINSEPDSGEVIAQRGVIPAARIQPVVPAIVKQNLADFRGGMLPCLEHNEQRRVWLKIGDVVGSRGVFQRLSQILVDLITGAKCTTVGELLVR